jgi:hypothetical protein
MTKQPVASEHNEQAAFFADISYRYQHNPEFVPELFYAIVNGFYAAGTGGRKFALLAKYRSEGWRPGIADVHYDQPRGEYNKLVIEMKRSDKRNTKDGGLRPDQIAYLEAARKAGTYVCVCYDADEAVAEFAAYMAMPIRERVIT